MRAAFTEHGSALLGFAVNALPDRGLAEDCVQETFLRAWRARASFDPAPRQRAHLAVRDPATRGARRLHAPVTGVRDRRHDDAARARRPGRDDPLEPLGIDEGLARLSHEHREAVVAVHVTGLSYQEWSEVSGVPVATLRTRVFYALRALRTPSRRRDPDR